MNTTTRYTLVDRTNTIIAQVEGPIPHREDILCFPNQVYYEIIWCTYTMRPDPANSTVFTAVPLVYARLLLQPTTHTPLPGEQPDALRPEPSPIPDPQPRLGSP